MPNKPKIFKCVKPGCNRVYSKNADFVAHYGKCVLGVLDSLKCSNCGKGFSNSQYWKRHRRNCQPAKKSLLLPLAERLKLAPLKQNVETDEDDVDDNREFAQLQSPIKVDKEGMIPETKSPFQQDIEDVDKDGELNLNLGSNDKSVYVYKLVDPHSRIPSYTYVPSFDEVVLNIKKEMKKEGENEPDEFIEEYLDDEYDNDDDDDDEAKN